MSLADITNDYVPVSRRKDRIPKGHPIIEFDIAVKLILLAVILIVGIFLGYYYITPFVCEVSPESCSVRQSVCYDCITMKNILSEENQCLHSHINSQEILDACSKQQTVQ